MFTLSLSALERIARQLGIGYRFECSTVAIKMVGGWMVMAICYYDSDPNTRPKNGWREVDADGAVVGEGYMADDAPDGRLGVCYQYQRIECAGTRPTEAETKAAIEEAKAGTLALSIIRVTEMRDDPGRIPQTQKAPPPP